MPDNIDRRSTEGKRKSPAPPRDRATTKHLRKVQCNRIGPTQSTPNCYAGLLAGEFQLTGPRKANKKERAAGDATPAAALKSVTLESYQKAFHLSPRKPREAFLSWMAKRGILRGSFSQAKKQPRDRERCLNLQRFGKAGERPFPFGGFPGSGLVLDPANAIRPGRQPGLLPGLMQKTAV